MIMISREIELSSMMREGGRESAQWVSEREREGMKETYPCFNKESRSDLEMRVLTFICIYWPSARTRSEGYCVCLSPGYLPSRAIKNDTSIQRRINVKKILWGFLWNCLLRSGENQVNKQISAGLPQMSARLLCVTWKHQRLQRGASIDSRMLSSSVASPLPTLKGDRKPSSGPAHQLAVQHMRVLPRAHFVLGITCSRMRKIF